MDHIFVIKSGPGFAKTNHRLPTDCQTQLVPVWVVSEISGFGGTHFVFASAVFQVRVGQLFAARFDVYVAKLPGKIYVRCTGQAQLAR